MALKVGKYIINLDLSGNSEKFKGKIDIDYSGNDGEVVLDGKEMHVESIKIGGNSHRFHQDRKNWKIILEGEVPAKGTISISYEGRISNGLQGLYYAGHGENSMLSTQFESNSAREMIPCFDNPSMKAVFSLSVKIKASLEAISNTTIKSERTSGATKEVLFNDTPSMSTYLLIPNEILHHSQYGTTLSIAYSVKYLLYLIRIGYLCFYGV